MTRRLILIRHAKSGWDDVFADDHARTLTERGQKAAVAIGAWLAAHGYAPDVILTSDAMRTRQTTALIKQGFGASPKTHEIAAFYLAAPQTIIDTCRALKDKSIAVIGHNPGIALAAELLVAEPPAHSGFANNPTGATTVIDFADDDWCKPGKGRVVDFVVPRDLT